MSNAVTLGGDRLGSGNNQKVYTPGYERSTHDLSDVLRTTQSPGTLVPTRTIIALPGDSIDIDIDSYVMTHPTIGACLGSYKLQYDVFAAPIRLYQRELQQNSLNIGNQMQKVLLPQITLRAQTIDYTADDITNQQVNPSSIFKYNGISGIGHKQSSSDYELSRDFMAASMIMYYECYKNYYANKQEEIGVIVHNDLETNVFTQNSAVLPAEPLPFGLDYLYNKPALTANPANWTEYLRTTETKLTITFDELERIDPADVYVGVVKYNVESRKWVKALDLWESYDLDYLTKKLTFTNPIDSPQWPLYQEDMYTGYWTVDMNLEGSFDTTPKLHQFPLADIDTLRRKIMEQDMGTPFKITNNTALEPWKSILKHRDVENEGEPTKRYYAYQSNQEGLAIKTYQSDLFNNWINTDWLDGENGVNAVTAVKTDADGKFTIDELNLHIKLYKMLNHIAMSGGTYSDWMQAVYDNKLESVSNPIYLGGLSKEIVFGQVVSNAATENEPLGSIAGQGGLAEKHKGGRVTYKVNEHSIIMVICSITPRIDVSQGNDWSVNLKTMDDFHKPPLDQLGFQELITDQMAWWETGISQEQELTTYSAGKQPVWVNYTTALNRVAGNFAKKNSQMFMVLDRRYEMELVPGPEIPIPRIKDLTTYIDPSKYNYIFADARLDAQNFWVQSGHKVTARRKMSAQQIPNL